MKMRELQHDTKSGGILAQIYAEVGHKPLRWCSKAIGLPAAQ